MMRGSSRPGNDRSRGRAKTTAASGPAAGPAPAPERRWARRLRASVLTSLLLVLGGSLTYTHATHRARTAAHDADRYAHQVHVATRVFVDWLQPSAVDRQLDAMALRRMRLLEQARFDRLRSIAVLVGLLGAIQLLITYVAAVVRRELAPIVDADEALLPAWEPLRDEDARTPSSRRMRPLPYRQARAASLKGM